MSFQENNQLGRGGKRPGAGRPTREEAEFKAAVADAVGTEMKRLAEKLAKRLVARALVNDRVLMFVISLAMAKAKQEVEVSGVKIFRIVAPKYDHEA
jgi:hypothetical protein